MLFTKPISTKLCKRSYRRYSVFEKKDTTHFGFTQVPKTEKQTLANKYDVMNDLMSLGVHRLWKDHLIRCLNPLPNKKLLDVAGDYCKRIYHDCNSKVIISDINEDMLNVGNKRKELQSYIKENQVEFKVCNAENLQLETNSVDYYTISFGIRNCTNIDRVLKEAHRVLRVGGKFVCLEFSKVENHMLNLLYEQYSFQIIPKIGKFIANDYNSYEYLVQSIKKFPNQQQFVQMIEDAGFYVSQDECDPGYENLSFGIAAIHTGLKIE